jgi:hypothetical protein
MALSGVGRHGGHQGSHGHGSHGHGHGHDALTHGPGLTHQAHHGDVAAAGHHDVAPGHAHTGHHGSDGSGHVLGAVRGGARAIRGSGGKASQWALALMSPKVLFSVLLGLGTSGIVLRSFLGGPMLFISALAGGIAFERLIVTPLWNFMLRFASRPALTLESMISEEATAVTTFDANGEGLVSVELDGQVVQVLGTLQRDDRALGARVRAGDRVRIEDVDTARNRCTVSVR